MKNIAIIFAGGTGSRMHNASVPKQFLEHNGKPIILYTIELFERHPQIDGIIVVCLGEWIPFLESRLSMFGIRKVCGIVPGGATGQESIFKGLEEAKRLYGECNVLVHDGVRPLITPQTITDNIEAVDKYGNCITCVPATETSLVRQKDGGIRIPSRADTLIARAPQSFRLGEILAAQLRARAEGRTDFIDCCTMMHTYGHELHTVIGPAENIKITTPSDFYVFKAFIKMRENSQILGL